MTCERRLQDFWPSNGKNADVHDQERKLKEKQAYGQKMRQECGLTCVRFEVSIRYPREGGMDVPPGLKKKINAHYCQENSDFC